MIASITPRTGVHFRPAFWGVERDLTDVVNQINSIWEGSSKQTPSHLAEFRETEKAYLMALDMPGISKKDLELEIQADQISVTGMRKKSLLIEESENQKILRTLKFPKDVEKEKIQARLEDGVLYLALPKMEKSLPKKIEISEGAQSQDWSQFLITENKD